MKSAELNGQQLKFVDNFIYLGHIVTEDRSDDKDIYKRFSKLNAVGNCIIRKFSFCTREVKLELFRSYCYSIYCNSLWSKYRVATLHKLRVCHNDILKRLLGIHRWTSSSLTFVTHNMKCLDVIRRTCIASLKARVEQSTNTLITDVRHSSAYVLGPMYKKWMNLLYV